MKTTKFTLSDVMTIFSENINWPEGTTEEQKNWMKAFLNRKAQELMQVCVIYTPNCGCEYESFVVLDRYPMSKKIISKCEVCKKGIFLEISNPIRFHQPWDEKDFELKDMIDMYISNDPTNYQFEWLLAYQKEAKKPRGKKHDK